MPFLSWTASGGGGGSGTVTTVSVVSANGLAGTVANPTTTPAITLSETVSGLLKGSGGSLAAATAADVPGVAGVTVSGTPSTGQVLTATSSSAADWAAAGGGGVPVVTFTFGSTGAAPSSGTYTAGAVAVDQNGVPRVCLTAGTPGTWARIGQQPYQFYVDDYGALGDGRVVGDASMTATQSTLHSTNAAFTSADNNKNIIVNGALGSSNAPLYGTVSSVAAGVATLSASATNTVSNAAVFLATDDSAAIVNCTTAASTYAQANTWHAQVLFSAKFYGLATLTTTTAGGSLAAQNALVPIPYPSVAGTTQKLLIEFIGVGEQADEQYFDSTIPSITGAALVATVAASGTTPSILGGPYASTNLTGTWINTKAIIKGITVWAGWNPGWVGIDLRQCAACWVDNAGAQVLAPAGGGQNPNLGVIPTNSNGWGIILPANNDSGAGRVMVEGYYYGMGISPRSTIEKLFTESNSVALLARSVNSTTTHGARVGYWSLQNCTTALSTLGTSGTMPLVIGLSDAASPVTTDLSDTHGILVGTWNWWSNTATAPVVSSGAVMKINNLLVTPGAQSSPASPPSSGSASTAIWQDTEVTLSITGGTMTALTIGGVDQHLPAGCVLWKFTVPTGQTFTPTYTGTAANDVTVL